MGMSNSKKLFNKYFLDNYPFWDPEEAVTEKNTGMVVHEGL